MTIASIISEFVKKNVSFYKNSDILTEIVTDKFNIYYDNTKINFNKFKKQEKEDFYLYLHNNIMKQIASPSNINDYRKSFINSDISDKYTYLKEIIEENFKFDFNLYSSYYTTKNENWESKDNKACNIIFPNTKIYRDVVILTSPFIKINSKNIINSFTIDVDFPELKGKDDELLKKANTLIKYFSIMKKINKDHYVPNFIVFTSKGFQLTYIFDNKVFNTTKQDLLGLIDARKNGIPFYVYKQRGMDLRDSAEKIEQFFNKTFKFLQIILHSLFNGDKYAIQTLATGRTVRNPVVNPSILFTKEKKNVFNLLKDIDNFAKAHTLIIKEINPFLKKDEIKEEEKRIKAKIKEAEIYVANKYLKKDELLEFDITTKQDMFKTYAFINDKEKELLKYCFYTLKLPFIDFIKAEGEGFRNGFIFSFIRYYAYDFKTKERDEVDYNQLSEELHIIANFINRNFKNPLHHNEITKIVKSIVKFVKTKYAGDDIKRRNTYLAQRKSTKTKFTLVRDIHFNVPFITTKQLDKMNLKEIKKFTKVSYSSLKRYGKKKIIKMYKEMLKSFINIKNDNALFTFLNKEKIEFIYKNVEEIKTSFSIGIFQLMRLYYREGEEKIPIPISLPNY